ncbi:hypothetical protein P3S68_028011 [Capsicum galapagoense]
MVTPTRYGIPKSEAISKCYNFASTGYPAETLVRFLKARDGSVSKTQKILLTV